MRLLLPGDTDFNGAFAAANAEHGVRQWRKAKGDSHALVCYEAGIKKDWEIVRLLSVTLDKLQGLYSDSTRTPEAMRLENTGVLKRMAEGYAQIRSRWHGDSRYDRTFAEPWNSARLNTVAPHEDLVTGFVRLLKFCGIAGHF